MNIWNKRVSFRWKISVNNGLSFKKIAAYDSDLQLNPKEVHRPWQLHQWQK
jgi:hypothetical protein